MCMYVLFFFGIIYLTVAYVTYAEDAMYVCITCLGYLVLLYIMEHTVLSRTILSNAM